MSPSLCQLSKCQIFSQKKSVNVTIFFPWNQRIFFEIFLNMGFPKKNWLLIIFLHEITISLGIQKTKNFKIDHKILMCDIFIFFFSKQKSSIPVARFSSFQLREREFQKWIQRNCYKLPPSSLGEIAQKNTKILTFEKLDA